MSEYFTRVIEILDEYSIIINYGRGDGAKEDDKVRVIEVGPEIIDPYTKASLGTLNSIKATLCITTVYNDFSICKDIEVRKTNIFASPLSQFQSTTRTENPLNVNKEEISDKKIPDSNIINIGDYVEIL